MRQADSQEVTYQYDNHSDKNKPRLTLCGLVKWKTPSGSDGEGGIMENLPGKDGHYKLRDQVNWPTPKEQDSRAAYTDRGKCNLGEQAQGGLPAQDSPSTNGKNRELWPTPVGTQNHYPGLGHWAKHKQKGKLNPAWVEQLMGLNTGWTDCDYSETG